MGSSERAKHIAKTMKDRTMKRLVRTVLVRCGNCFNRASCLYHYFPFPKIVVAFTQSADRRYGDTSLVSRAAARFLSSSCYRCDRLERCVKLMTEATHTRTAEEHVLHVLEAWREYSEEEIAEQIEYVMSLSGLTAFDVLARATHMLVDCKAEGKFRSAIQ